MKRRLIPFLLGTGVLALAAGCNNDSSSGSGDSGTASADVISGVFVDDPVHGLRFTVDGASGYTDAAGTFSCEAGGDIVFSIGNLTLGSAPCADLITPLDLVPGADADDPVVRAIAGLLQSLDADGDQGNGVILISSEVVDWVNEILSREGYDSFNAATASAADIDALTQDVVALSQEDGSGDNDLAYVPPGQAGDHLDASMAALGLFRKNITKSPELATDHVTLDVMSSVRVAPRRADGSDPEICDNAGNCITPDTVNPLFAFYLEPPEDKPGAEPHWGNEDAWVAVSLDNGASWKRTNLSNSSDKSVSVGDNPYADVNSVNGVVEGDKALVTWISTYCPSGNPMELAPIEGDSEADPVVPAADMDAMTLEDLSDPSVYNTYDLFRVAGSQGIADYTDSSDQKMYRPEVGQVAFHCVWAARGVHAGGGEIVWRAPEQITSGRRDAKLDAPSAATSPDGTKGGFAIVWQEDPVGLMPGSGEGPGVGWSGASTNKKTDIWYTSIDMACFDATGEAAEAEGCYPAKNNDTVTDGRPKPAYRMAAPVPVSDNRNCVLGTSGDAETWNSPHCKPLGDDVGTIELATQRSKESAETAQFALSGEKNPMCAVDGIELSPYWADTDWMEALGTLQDQCDSFDPATNSVPLDGDTAASRPNLHMVYDESIDDVRALVTYEEKKALKFLCAGDLACEDTRYDLIGKFVLFHSFRLGVPEPVRGGGIMNTLTHNYADTDGNGVGDSIAMAGDGQAMRYIFENARRERVAVQDAGNAAYANGKIGSRDLRMLMIYKYGLFNKGQTADLMIQRACGGYEFEHWGSCADEEPVARTPICITCVSVTEAEPQGSGDHVAIDANTDCLACHSEGEIFDDTDISTRSSTITAKALDWAFQYNGLTDNNLYMDPVGTTISRSVSSYNPLDDARSLRADLAGDMVLVGFAWTPNWAAARHFNDTYDFFVRRSFDGGFSWTDASGTLNEGPVNVSNLANHKEIIVEPRLLVQDDCGYNAALGTAQCPNADGGIQSSASVPFVATYCTAQNIERVVTEADYGGSVHAPGLDCFFAISTDYGDTYINSRDADGDGSDIALLAANHDTLETANECDEDGTVTGSEASYCEGEEGFDWLAKGDAEMLEPDVRLLPSIAPEYTHTLHSVWLQEGEHSDSRPQDGIDGWYRRVDYILE